MSCLEHRCMDCGYIAFNNNPRSPLVCPQCGGDDFQRTWDEQSDYDRERAEERE